MILDMALSKESYPIYIERGALDRAGEYFNLKRRVLIVTDTGVPSEYAEKVAKAAKEPTVVTINAGESSKCMAEYSRLLSVMTHKGFTRNDAVVAVGGGVVGDLSGFVAASYMRGIDFYNIPTTLLSQVDSSIGGKVAIDFEGYKNIVGAFYQPKAVIVDPNVLSTLPKRQLSNGMAEALKMSMTSDPELFSIFEQGKAFSEIDTVIERSLKIKKSVVEQDEKESGLRKILNFGHTVAHAIESEYGFLELYHGECVALGMVAMCSGELRERLLKILKNLNLPTFVPVNYEKLIDAMRHDKKMSGNEITVVYVPEIGKYELKTMPFEELKINMKEVFPQ